MMLNQNAAITKSERGIETLISKFSDIAGRTEGLQVALDAMKSRVLGHPEKGQNEPTVTPVASGSFNHLEQLAQRTLRSLEAMNEILRELEGVL